MQIRKATMNDLPDILAIYAYARKYMKEQNLQRPEIRTVFDPRENKKK